MTGQLPARYDDRDGEYTQQGQPVSARSRGVGLALGVFGGFLGLHRFYVGRTHSAVIMALTLGGMGVWWFYDMVLLVSGEFRDADELPLREWGVQEGAGRSAVLPAEVRQLAEQVDSLRFQMSELAERVDFAERMLAQQKERARLPRGE
jgi:TM2 domain-containing membrane protein YozV